MGGWNKSLLGRECLQNNGNQKCSFLLELFLLLLLKSHIVWLKMNYDCTYLKLLRSGLPVHFISIFEFSAKSSDAIYETFPGWVFPETLMSESLCQGFLGQDHFFHWNLSWRCCPCGGILIVWIYFQRRCPSFSPFSSYPPVPPLLPLSKKLPVNNKFSMRFVQIRKCVMDIPTPVCSCFY